MAEYSVRTVLVVIHYPIFGGPHNELLRLSGPLRARGWRLIGLLPDEAQTAAQRLRGWGVEVVQAPLHRLRRKMDPVLQGRYLLNLPSDVRRIRSIIRSQRVDLIQVAGLINPQAAIAAVLERLPVLWQVIDSRAPSLVRHSFMRLVTVLADQLMFDGRTLVDMHGGPAAVSRVPWLVYYPPVDTRLFKPDAAKRAAMRRRLGIPADATVVGTVANLNPQKGIEYFIRAARHIYATQPNTWFLIVGASYANHRGYSDLLTQEVRRSSVPSEHFIFAGATSHPEDFYAAMDIKLITSLPDSEGTTTTAMEAMACGLAVVAADVGAVHEVVQAGVTGCLVPPCKPDDLAAASIELMQNPERRQRMGATARGVAVERYDVAVCADTYATAYQGALKRACVASRTM
jgi:glycosyltransferase involved in cell wall biosynthesis